jgi:hypothetical protein
MNHFNILVALLSASASLVSAAPRARIALVDDYHVFLAGFTKGNWDLCDHMMEDREFHSSIPFVGNYATEDLMKLVDRFPSKIDLFLPEANLLRGTTGEGTLALIDYIEYCKAKSEVVATQNEQLAPSNLLRVVLQNHRLTDDEMALAIQRLRQQGAQLAERSAEGFAGMDDVWLGFELLDSRVVFNRMYPNYPKSYKLLFENTDNSFGCIIS